MPSDLLLHTQLRKLLNVDEPYFSVEKNKVTVRVATEAQSKLLLETNSLCMKNVEPKVEARYNTRIGTMLLDRLRVDNEPNEVLCECINDILTAQKHNVLDVKIYERTSTKTRKNLRIAKVTFGQQTIPHYMKVGVKKISIQEDFPKPMQCRICLKFEHTHKRCPNKEDLKEKRCFKCGKEGHDDDVCAVIECYNCGGSHHAFSRECSYYKYYQEALIRSREHGISLRDAKIDMREDGIILKRSSYSSKLKHTSINSLSKEKNKVPHPFKRSVSLENVNRISVQNRYSILDDDEICTDNTQHLPNILPPATPPVQSDKAPVSSKISSPPRTSHNLEATNDVNSKEPQEVPTIPEYETIEKQLMELDGTPEYTKRALADSSSDESNAPVKKQMKETLKEAVSISGTKELLPVPLDKSTPKEILSVRRKDVPKASGEIIPVKCKSLIHDYPMPPSSNQKQIENIKVSKQEKKNTKTLNKDKDNSSKIQSNLQSKAVNPHRSPAVKIKR